MITISQAGVVLGTLITVCGATYLYRETTSYVEEGENVSIYQKCYECEPPFSPPPEPPRQVPVPASIFLIGGGLAYLIWKKKRR